MTLPIGTQLGGYVLAGVLGSGASGTVYRAADAEGLTVALKLLHPSTAADPAARRRLAREVEAQRAIRSPFVARVVDVELDGAEVFIVTELVEGISLAGDIGKNGPWQDQDLALLAGDLDQALAAVHAAGVVHRDVKPSNVVLGRTGRPVLIDFGIAQGLDADRLTGAGLVAGTPGFVSPELLRGGHPTPESDRWAAAALLLNAATGRQPFGSGPIEAVIARVLDGLADVDGLPGGIADAFLAALDVDPARRIGLPDLALALWPGPDGPAPPAEPPAEPPEDLPPTLVAPLLPGEGAEGPTEHLWTEPPVVHYRSLVPPAPSYPPVQADQLDDAVRPLPSPYPAPPPPVRGLTLGLWLLLSALALRWPWAAAAAGAAGLVAARTVWMAVQALTMRRFRRGQRASDPARVAFGLPWYLLRGLAGALPALALGAALGLGADFGLVRWAGLGGWAGEIGAAAVAGFLAVAWWGPSGAETRHGQRAALRWLLRTPLSRALAALALLVGGGALLALWPW
ncbi:MAG: serine/threonine protein kinase [Bifidobacteriaceae bacterium]|jgi:serine/threonine protein kinase|nr:serine/threonine protein kinase [Bifidobacteriaceae bacterium]